MDASYDEGSLGELMHDLWCLDLAQTSNETQGGILDYLVNPNAGEAKAKMSGPIETRCEASRRKHVQALIELRSQVANQDRGIAGIRSTTTEKDQQTKLFLKRLEQFETNGRNL